MQNFERLYHSAPCGLVSFDLDGWIVEANQTFTQWVDLPQETVFSRKITDFLDKGSKFYYELFVLPILRVNRQVKEVSLNFSTGDNSFSALFSACTYQDNDKNLVNASLFRIEDRKKFEQELLKKKEKAESDGLVKSKALEEVAFNQAHLIRAPLANILALTDMLKQMQLGDDAKEVIELLAESSNNLDTQVRIIVDKSNLH